MKYAPGSFSKNFAWHGTGLRRLHTAIRKGFHGQLGSVSRKEWRADSGIGDRNLELVPVNFILYNRAGSLPVDELVYQAVTKPHSLRFDRLALFAFHLSRVGTGVGVVSRPAMWANEFVRERLWHEDAWRAAMLAEGVMDAFIDERLDAAKVVRTKCRSNYRHLFELCEYLPAQLEIINTGPEHWVGAALFLAWDRALLDGGKAAKADLISLVGNDELHKLLGASKEWTLQQADVLADVYLEAGNFGRFVLPPTLPAAPVPTGSPLPTPGPASRGALSPTPSSTSIKSPKPVPASEELPEEATNEWIDQEESDAAIDRQVREVQAQVRNRKKAAAMCRHYKNTCVFCHTKLQVGPARWYSEAAHVKPLGKPHNGPDRTSNMIVLCPNHHLQFDRGVLRMKKAASGFVVHSQIGGDPLHGRPVLLSHTLHEEFVLYHWRWHSVRRN